MTFLDIFYKNHQDSVKNGSIHARLVIFGAVLILSPMLPSVKLMLQLRILFGIEMMNWFNAVNSIILQ